MSHKAKPPAGWRPGAAPNSVQLGGLNTTYNSPDKTALQVARLRGRFGLSLALAAVLAHHAYAAEALR